jgi:hypothetical protein
MRSRALFPLVLALACQPTPAPKGPVVAAIQSAAAEPVEELEPLVRVILHGNYPRERDCGHDDAVGDLGCAYTGAGTPRPLADERVLRLYLTEPPGLVLAASDWQPARVLEPYEGEAAVAECAYERRGALREVLIAVSAGASSLYLGELPVYALSACEFQRHDGVPERVAAAHLVIMHDGSMRKPAHVQRSRDEALALARRAARDAATAVPFAELADRYSDEPAAADRGGELGSFAPRMMAPVFSLVLLGTLPGARSPAFETAFGFHLLERHADPGIEAAPASR